MDEIADLFTRHIFYHATSLEATEQIVQEGFRERIFGSDGDLLRNFRSLLIRYGFHGYGNPTDDNGIVLFSGDRVVLHSLIGELPPSIHRHGYEDDFAAIPSTEEVRRIFMRSGSEPAGRLAARIASRSAGDD